MNPTAIPLHRPLTPSEAKWFSDFYYRQKAISGAGFIIRVSAWRKLSEYLSGTGNKRNSLKQDTLTRLGELAVDALKTDKIIWRDVTYVSRNNWGYQKISADSIQIINYKAPYVAKPLLYERAGHILEIQSPRISKDLGVFASAKVGRL